VKVNKKLLASQSNGTMKFIKTIERLQKLERLIQTKKTGAPSMLAERLKISRRQLFNILEDLKLMGAPIKYNKVIKSYYYEEEFGLDIQFKIQFTQTGYTPIVKERS